MAVSVGTSRHEIVLRGGFLAKPEVVTGIIEVHGMQFWRLAKQDSILNKFLTAGSLCKRPLANTSVIESLLMKRNDEWHNRLAAFATATEEPMTTTDDCLESLKLDDNPTTPNKKEASSQKKKSPKAMRKVAHLMPGVATVELERKTGSGATWKVTVLLENPLRQAPAIEVTAVNLQVLLDEVEYEINDGETRPKKRRAHREEEGCEPFGERGRRSYFTPSKGGFVTKVKHLRGKKPFSTNRVRTRKRGRPGMTPEEEEEGGLVPAI
jgi:hypothetical protein